MKAWRKPLDAALQETSSDLEAGKREACVLMRFNLSQLMEAVAKMEGVEQKELDYVNGRAQAAFDDLAR